MRFFPLAAVKIAVCRKYPRYQLNTRVTVLSKQTVMEVVVPFKSKNNPTYTSNVQNHSIIILKSEVGALQATVL